MLKHKVSLFCYFLFLTGCALTRGEIDLRVDEIPDPASTLTVKITEVVDRRVFHEAPPEPFMPSLSKDEVNDRSIQKRAIARKRNAYGQALGDILLPQGRTVETLTKESLTKALRESGIRVVSEGEQGYDDAVPLQADIQKFWAWFSPGFWEITLQYEAQIALKGNWPVAEGDREIKGTAKVTGAVASTTEWKQLFDEGIKNLIDNTKRVIKTTSDKISRLLSRQFAA